MSSERAFDSIETVAVALRKAVQTGKRPSHEITQLLKLHSPVHVAHALGKLGVPSPTGIVIRLNSDHADQKTLSPEQIDSFVLEALNPPHTQVEKPQSEQNSPESKGAPRP